MNKSVHDAIIVETLNANELFISQRMAEAGFHRFSTVCRNSKKFGVEFVTPDPKNNGMYRIDNNIENADYVSFHDKAIVELKCLEFDHASINYKNGININGPLIGRDDEQGFQGELHHRICVNLKKIVSKASSQISKTKEYFNAPTYKGVVLLYNKGNPSATKRIIEVAIEEYVKDAGNVAINTIIFANDLCDISSAPSFLTSIMRDKRALHFVKFDLSPSNTLSEPVLTKVRSAIFSSNYDVFEFHSGPDHPLANAGNHGQLFRRNAVSEHDRSNRGAWISYKNGARIMTGAPIADDGSIISVTGGGNIFFQQNPDDASLGEFAERGNNCGIKSQREYIMLTQSTACERQQRRILSLRARPINTVRAFTIKNGTESYCDEQVMLDKFMPEIDGDDISWRVDDKYAELFSFLVSGDKRMAIFTLDGVGAVAIRCITWMSQPCLIIRPLYGCDSTSYDLFYSAFDALRAYKQSTKLAFYTDKYQRICAILGLDHTYNQPSFIDGYDSIGRDLLKFHQEVSDCDISSATHDIIQIIRSDIVHKNVSYDDVINSIENLFKTNKRCDIPHISDIMSFCRESSDGVSKVHNTNMATVNRIIASSFLIKAHNR